MKVYAEKLIKIEVDKICDVCEESVIIYLNGVKHEKSGELKATFGYDSQKDGNLYHLDLCENCFKTALHSLRDQRRAQVKFDKEKIFPDEKFGLDHNRT
jgi:hypothetical protein